MDKRDKDMLKLILFSFGFKHGAPVDASFLFDARFLPNPYWEENLRHLSGQDPEVSSYVVESEQGRQFFDLLKPLLLFVSEQIRAGGKQELRIGIGCTGGRHRSVAVVEALGRILDDHPDLELMVFHRDIDK